MLAGCKLVGWSLGGWNVGVRPPRPPLSSATAATNRSTVSAPGRPSCSDVTSVSVVGGGWFPALSPTSPAPVLLAQAEAKNVATTTAIFIATRRVCTFYYCSRLKSPSVMTWTSSGYSEYPSIGARVSDSTPSTRVQSKAARQPRHPPLAPSVTQCPALSYE